MCEMTSANYAAWHGVSCSWNGTACSHFSSQHNEYCALPGQGEDACYQSNNGLMGPLYSFLSGDSGCWSLDNETCTNNQNCTWYSSSSSSYTSCEPLVAAVNASMLSTGAHAAITEYAIAEKRRYTCDSLDESTCSSVDGCKNIAGAAERPRPTARRAARGTGRHARRITVFGTRARARVRVQETTRIAKPPHPKAYEWGLEQLPLGAGATQSELRRDSSRHGVRSRVQHHRISTLSRREIIETAGTRWFRGLRGLRGLRGFDYSGESSARGCGSCNGG